MIELKPDECRVLGVLVEKSLTTPGQYPLSINGIVVGCSQKSNREPVKDYSEERVYDAIDVLSARNLVIRTHLTGSRVPKFRHNSREVLNVDTPQLVVLAELLLRGPQTEGELRGRASRMHQLESLDVVRTILADLTGRKMVRKLPPVAGSRAACYGQLLCPDLHPVTAEPVSTAAAASSAPSAAPPPTSTDPSLVQRVDRLEAELARLRRAIEKLAESLGESSLLENE